MHQYIIIMKTINCLKNVLDGWQLYNMYEMKKRWSENEKQGKEIREKIIWHRQKDKIVFMRMIDGVWWVSFNTDKIKLKMFSIWYNIYHI